MEEELISKKELLQLTGISYGALYRWKRKMLIPEEWFIKKTVFTGQETFFPKDKILERIAKIQEMKEDLALDDLAKIFSGTPINIETTVKKMVEDGLVTNAILQIKMLKEDDKLDFYGVLYVCLCNHLLMEGYVHLMEVDSIMTLLLEEFKKFEMPPKLCIYRKHGNSFSLLIPEGVEYFFDKDVKNIVMLPILEFMEKLKSSYNPVTMKEVCENE